MFQLKKRIIWFVQLIALASACWTTHGNIRTGTFSPITTLTSNYSAPINYVVPYIGTALTLPTLPQNFSYGLGLVGYQSYLTLAFSFNVANTNINTTHLSLTIKVEDGSYLASLRLNYIIVSYYAAMANTLEVISGCFKCLNISQDINITQGLRVRSENFTQRSALGNIPKLQTRAFLFSFNFSNYYGQTNYLQVTTYHDRSIGNYTHIVTTTEYNRVNYVCLSVITWNSNHNNFGNGFAATFRDYNLDMTNKTSIVDYYAGFDCDNLKFMGFSFISHLMGGKRILGVHPQIYNNFRLNTSFDSNNFTLESSLTIFYFGTQYCNTALLPLYAPSKLDCVGSCPDPQYVKNSSKCIVCPSYCGLCDINNVTNCTSCLPGSNRVNASCDCSFGYFQKDPNNKTLPCLTCSDFIPFCVNCTNSTYCLNCSTGKYSVNGTCQCQSSTTRQTYLVNGVCLDFPGCLNASLITTGKYCDVCNTSANFRRPNITNLTCICIPKYNNNATPTLCVPDCGDGQIFTEECDDGNKNNSDGCNSTCQVEPGWFCYMNTTTNVSNCMQAQNGSSIKYLYAQRIVGTNTALLFFSFLPAGRIIDPYVFRNAIATNAPISTITPTYDSVNSSITLLVAFKESLQGNPYNFTFSFSSSYIYYTNPITALVVPQGINQQLIFQSYSIVVKTMQYTIMGTAFLGLGLGMVCAGVGYKLMGLQLILPMQSAFFAQFSMTNPPPYVSTLKNMKYTMGYNQLLPYEYQNFVGSNSKFAKFDFQIEMALNLNIMLGLLFLATIGLLIFQVIYLYHYFEAAQSQKKNAPPPPSPQSKKKIKGKTQEHEVFQVKQVGVYGLALKQARQSRNAYVNNFYFYISAILAQSILFCFIIQNSQYAVSEFYLSEDINIMAGYLSLLLMVGNLVFMLLQWGQKKDRRIITFQQTRVIKYPIFLIISCLMMPLAMAVCINFSFSSQIASALGALPVIGLIYFRPYRHQDTKLNAFSAFINLVFPMIASGIYLANSIMKLSQFGWVLSVGIIVVWQFATETTTIIRMVKTIPWRDLPVFERCVKKRKRSDDRLLEKQKADIEMTSMVKNRLKGDGQIVDWEERNKKEYESISQKPENQDAEISDHNEEEDELAQLKRRLKKEIMMKKAH